MRKAMRSKRLRQQRSHKNAIPTHLSIKKRNYTPSYSTSSCNTSIETPQTSSSYDESNAFYPTPASPSLSLQDYSSIAPDNTNENKVKSSCLVAELYTANTNTNVYANKRLLHLLNSQSLYMPDMNYFENTQQLKMTSEYRMNIIEEMCAVILR